jgi:hypothetical protein
MVYSGRSTGGKGRSRWSYRQSLDRDEGVDGSDGVAAPFTGSGRRSKKWRRSAPSSPRSDPGGDVRSHFCLRPQRAVSVCKSPRSAGLWAKRGKHHRKNLARTRATTRVDARVRSPFPAPIARPRARPSEPPNKPLRRPSPPPIANVRQVIAMLADVRVMLG